MRLLGFVLVLSLASPAFAGEVRVKSKHETAMLEGGVTPCHRVGAEETLRAGVIGPGKVKVTLRRFGTGTLAAVPVKLMRDGREIAKLSVGGKLFQAIVGEPSFASVPVDKVLDIPAGPHTLFIEVGAGKGQILVSFDEQRPATIVKAEPKAEPEPPKVVAKVEPKKEPKAEPKKEPEKVAKAEPGKTEPKAEPKKEPEKVAKAEPGKTEPKTEPAKAETLAKLEPEKTATKTEPAKAEPEKVADAKPRPGGKLWDDDTPEPPKPAAKPRTSRLSDDDVTSLVDTATAKVEPAQPTPSADPQRVRFLIGPRLGASAQTQLGALGPAVGLSFRWALVGKSTRSGTQGLLLGLSADMVRYGIEFQVPAAGSVGAFSDTVTATTVPVMLEATYSFGDPKSARLTPYVGIDVGGAFGSLKAETPWGEENRGFARFAAGAHLGLEIPIGSDRLGVEARYLWARMGKFGPVHELELGGVLLQASWRFGL